MKQQRGAIDYFTLAVCLGIALAWWGFYSWAYGRGYDTATGAAAQATAVRQAADHQERATAERLAREQSEAHREKERQLREDHDKIEREAQTALAAAATGADRAHAAGQRLRRELADYLTQHRARALAGAAAGQCAPDTPPLDLLADLQRRADDRAGELAHIADTARARGTACERAYDSARATLNTEAQPHE